MLPVAVMLLKMLDFKAQCLEQVGTLERWDDKLS